MELIINCHCWAPNVSPVELHQWMSNRWIPRNYGFTAFCLRALFSSSSDGNQATYPQAKYQTFQRNDGQDHLQGCGLNVCVPPNTYVVNLMPQVMVLGGGDFGRWYSHEGGALMIGISALLEEAPES